jgi:hypothetical protein
MPRRTKSTDTERSAHGRRGFLKAATLAGTGAIAAAGAIAQAAASPEASSPQGAKPQGTTCGSDFMVDVMRNLGIDYVAAIPGNTFKGLHESIINYSTGRRWRQYKPDRSLLLHQQGVRRAPSNVTEGQPGAPREWMVTIKRNF